MNPVSLTNSKLVVTAFLSLDGVVESPEQWVPQFWNKELAQFKHDELFSTSALLLGRKTYETFAGAWPSRTDKNGFADRMNGLPKHVASATLKNPAWENTSVIDCGLAEYVTSLKKSYNQDISVHGSRTLVQSLIAQGLVDQFNLVLFPVILGRGFRLFGDCQQLSLKAVESMEFASGVRVLVYRILS